MEKEIHKMALYYILNNINIPYLGLSKGKMGLSLFYFHYSMHTHNSVYEQFAYELLNDIIEDINDEMPSIYNWLLLNSLQVISRKYGRSL